VATPVLAGRGHDLTGGFHEVKNFTVKMAGNRIENNLATVKEKAEPLSWFGLKINLVST
jgi:hypothetical protein